MGPCQAVIPRHKRTLRPAITPLLAATPRPRAARLATTAPPPPGPWPARLAGCLPVRPPRCRKTGPTVRPILRRTSHRPTPPPAAIRPPAIRPLRPRLAPRPARAIRNRLVDTVLKRRLPAPRAMASRRSSTPPMPRLAAHIHRPIPAARATAAHRAAPPPTAIPTTLHRRRLRPTQAIQPALSQGP